MAPWIHVPGLDGTVSAYGLASVAVVLWAIVATPASIHAFARIAFDARAVAVTLVLLVFAFAGARALFVVTHWSLFAHRPLDALAFWNGGRHAAGAIVMVALAAPPLLRWARIPAGRFADAGVPVVCIGLAIARIGCLLHGCCAGTPCDGPWCLTYPAASSVHTLHRSAGLIAADAVRSAAVHPLPLYFAAAAVGTALVAAWQLRRPHRDWDVVLTALLLFGSTSAALEPLRADYPGRAHWGQLPQLAGVALVVAGIALLGLGLRRIARQPLAVSAGTSR